MDLHDFTPTSLYFDEKLPLPVQSLLSLASRRYGQGVSERALLEASRMAPRSLTVLVGLYRHYYYQHRLLEARDIAYQSLAVVAEQLSLPAEWHKLSVPVLLEKLAGSIGLVRFYLLALKGAGFLCVRLGDIEEGKQMLQKVMELDSSDRCGAGALLAVVTEHTELDALAYEKEATV